MADWNTGLPPEAVEGADTHVEDHNSIVDALREVRTRVESLEGASLAIGDVSGLQSALDGKATAAALSTLEGRVEALEPEE
ncbi:MAG: hypothetical protein L0I80_12395 [Brevibacterium sp.]|nr:hypothetical protein [Brevibacterium sp.]